MFVGLFPEALELVPIPGLAALLVYTGHTLINVQAIRTLSTFGRKEVVVYAVTLVTIVTTDLLIGVLAGLGVALAKLFYSINTLKVAVDRGTNTKPNSSKFSDTATFVNLPKFANALDDVPLKKDIHKNSAGYSSVC